MGATFTPIKKLFLLIIFHLPLSLSLATDTLTPSQSLSGNDTLISASGTFALGFFTPGSNNNRFIGIWYQNIPIQTITWVANRDNPVIDHNTTLTLTNTGSLTLTNLTGTIWSTPSTKLTNPVAQLLDNGNFVVKQASDNSTNYSWQSFDYLTDTLMAGMKIGVDRARGITTTVRSWKTPSDPSSGDYYVAFVTSGDPEMFLWSGSTKIWRTGPWDGLQFSGIPDTTTYQNFTFTFVNTQQETTYSFDVTDSSIISRLVVNSTGLVQRAVWIDGGGDWNYFWYAPRDQCDYINECGHYGECNPNNSPICQCFQGFTPRYPANWALRDGSGGCVRKTALDCHNGTDGFVTVPGVKLPDTTNSTVDWDLDLDTCKNLCLGNCSCTGYAAANASGSGSGCIIWATELTDVRVYTDTGGQNLYLRLAAKDLVYTPSQTHKKKHPTIAIVVSILLTALIMLTGAGYFLWRKKRKRTGFFSTNSFNDESGRGNDFELSLYDMETVVAATDNFSFSNKVGEGGFGPVYKGKLGDGQEIAVKRLGKTSIQGLDEFKNEVVLIAKLQHRNLVRLLGCCIQGVERLLIYEYMPNRSLDAFLFDKARAMLLDWQTRYTIIAGIARGLLYLHQDSRLRIIHRDLKASNILLDKEMNPKISDFGMARIFGGEETETSTRRIVGTYGYMSPEYAMDGIFSVKSDVFSFGVLILEIVSGKKNRGVYNTLPHVNLLGHAWSLWNGGNSLQLVDESFGLSFNMNEVIKCIRIGLLCVQEHPEDRPLMSDLVLMLGSDNMSLPNPKQPGFALRRLPLDTESSSSKQESSTLNDMSFTMFEGR